jgi:hypothetical protein
MLSVKKIKEHYLKRALEHCFLIDELHLNNDMLSLIKMDFHSLIINHISSVIVCNKFIQDSYRWTLTENVQNFIIKDHALHNCFVDIKDFKELKEDEVVINHKETLTTQVMNDCIMQKDLKLSLSKANKITKEEILALLI